MLWEAERDVDGQMDYGWGWIYGLASETWALGVEYGIAHTVL